MARKFYKEDNQQLPAIEFVETQPVGFTEITNADEITVSYKHLTLPTIYSV